MSTQSHKQDPYLSVVVTSRNDNHGGTLTRRMQTFINALIAQCKRHQLPAELIIVEWNPPADKPKLAQELHWPPDLGPCEIRILEVSREIHSRYQFAKVLPLYQFIAKNVGIRRARGEFILATNIDVILNHSLMEFLASRRLEKGKMYRIDRHDTQTEVPVDAPIDDVLEYCATHLLRLNARGGTFPVGPTGRRLLEPVDIAAPDSGIILGNGWFEIHQTPPPDPTAYRFAADLCDISVEAAAFAAAGPTPHLVMDVQPGPKLGHRPFTMIAERNETEICRTFVLSRQKISIPLPPGEGGEINIRLHCQGIQEEVPYDPRSLCVIVHRIEVLPAASIAEPVREVFPVESGLAAGSGWYAPEPMSGCWARWMNNHAEVWFAPGTESGRRYLILDLEPGPSLDHRPFLLTISDDQEKQILTVCVMGRQILSVPVEIVPGKLTHWVLSLSSPNLPVSNDTRILNALLRRIELSAAPAMEAADDEDVFTSARGLAAGRGWYAPERTTGGWARWMDNDAEIWFAPRGQSGQRYLVLDLESGPGLDHQPFLLRISDQQGAEVFTTLVMGRQSVSAPVEIVPDNLTCWVLSVASPNFPVPGDTRLLNVLARRIELSDAPIAAAVEEDVFPRTLGFTAGRGWYSPEQRDARCVRWMNNDAKIWFIPRKSGVQYLVMDLETGPSLSHLACQLTIHDEAGAEIFRHVLVGRQHISVPLELTAGELGCIVLRVESQNLSVPGDTRTLNLLLNQIEFCQQPAKALADEDVFAASRGLAAGTGWYGPEFVEGGYLRWMDNDAQVCFALSGNGDNAVGREIVMDMEAGPSLGSASAKLRATDEQGREFFATTLSGRQRVAIPVPAPRSNVGQFTLHVESQNLPVATDPRRLNVLVRKVELTPADAPGDSHSPPKPHRASSRLDLRTPPPSRANIAIQPPEPMPPPANASLACAEFLHNNACGDFTLMHRDHWFEVRGHAEWDTFSINLDSLLCFCAHHSGAVETVLEEPMRCYHIEHSLGSGWTPQGIEPMLRRIRSLGIPDVDWRDVAHIGMLLRRHNSPATFSPSDWGLEHEVAPETRITHDDRQEITP